MCQKSQTKGNKEKHKWVLSDSKWKNVKRAKAHKAREIFPRNGKTGLIRSCLWAQSHFIVHSPMVKKWVFTLSLLTYCCIFYMSKSNRVLEKRVMKISSFSNTHIIKYCDWYGYSLCYESLQENLNPIRKQEENKKYKKIFLLCCYNCAII